MAAFNIADIYAEIDKQATQFGVDPRMAKAFLTVENTGDGDTTSRSTYRADAVSPVGARGLMQVMPSTARGLQKVGLLPADWTHDPANLSSGIAAGLAAMKDMQSRQKNPGDVLELAAMYNGGNYNQQQYLKGGALSPETAKYLPSVQRAYMELGGQMTPQQIERAAMTKQLPGQAAGQRASNSVSTSRSIYDPAALDAFNTAGGLLTNSGGLFDQAFSAVDQRNAAVQTAGVDLMSAIGLAGQAAGAAATKKAELEAAGTLVHSKILEDANLDPRATNGRMQQALAAIDATSVELDRLRPDIDARTKVGFFDNPLEWLVNQTRLPGMIGEYNNIVQVQQDAIGKYDAASSIAGKQISLGTALNADKILESGAALADATAAKAVADQKQVQLQLASKTAADALTAVQLGLQARSVAQQDVQLTRIRQSETQALSDAAASRKVDEKSVSDLNEIIKAAGGVGIDMARFKQLPAAERAQLMQATSGGKFGKDLASSLSFIDEYGSLNGMGQGGQLGVVQWVQKSLQAGDKIAIEEQQKAIATGNKAFNPKNAKLAALAAVGAQYQTQAEGDMRRASEGNPFKLDYATQIKAPELANNVWANVIRKYGPGGPEQLYDKADEKIFIQRALIDIKTSKDPAAAVKKYAADISQFYTLATANQAKETKYSLFGLTKPQKTYSVHLPGLMAKDTDTVDLGNSTKVENFLTNATALEWRRALMNGGINPLSLVPGPAGPTLAALKAINDNRPGVKP